jgi:glycosyltransferase involved in cell wall biosynthesis
MLVSVVIPTKSRPEAIVDAVRSVFAGSYQQFEMFVVDQTPDESTRDALAPFMAEQRFHYLQNRRQGYGAASSRNMGIALSSGEVIAIMDDDVEARANWLERIVEEFIADPELQYICGALTAPPYDQSTGFVPAFKPEPDLTNWRLPLVAAGANLSMRRSLFARIGGYDEFCGPGSRLRASDDGDISYRMMRSGAKWKGCADIEVIHTHGFRPGTDADKLHVRYEYGNGAIFGRFTRRGDPLAGIVFATRELRQLLKVLANTIRRRQPTGFEYSAARLRGFWNGFIISPREGFVSGTELARRRAELSSNLAITEHRNDSVAISQ